MGASNNNGLIEHHKEVVMNSISYFS